MITAITYLPAKYTKEVRKEYILMVEDLVEKILGVPKEQAAIANHFVPMDEICYIGADTKTIYIYNAENFTIDQKAQMTKSYDEKCAEMFGEDKGMTIVIFKPHQNDEVMVDGM